MNWREQLAKLRIRQQSFQDQCNRWGERLGAGLQRWRGRQPGAFVPPTPAEPIRLLLVIPTLDQSGAEKQLALLASHLPRPRFQVHVVALTRGGYYQQQLEKAGIAVTILHKQFKLDPLALFRLISLIRQWRPHIIHSWLFAANSYTRVASWFAPVCKRVVGERCVDQWKSRFERWVDRCLLQSTEALVGNAHAVTDYYRRLGITPPVMEVLPNAVEPLVVKTPVPKERQQQCRQERLAALGLSSNVKLIGFIGRLWPQKRVQDLIWALDVLRIANQPVDLVVIGDGPARPKLELFARNLHRQQNVHFLGHRSDAQEWLAAIDLLVLPSEFEGTPNVVLEAMQAGVPVVATRIAGSAEWLQDGVTGLLVPPRAPFELAKALQSLLQDPDLAQRLAAAAALHVQQRHSLPTMIQAHVQFYERLIQTEHDHNQK